MTGTPLVVPLRETSSKRVWVISLFSQVVVPAELQLLLLVIYIYIYVHICKLSISSRVFLPSNQCQIQRRAVLPEISGKGLRSSGFIIRHRFHSLDLWVTHMEGSSLFTARTSFRIPRLMSTAFLFALASHKSLTTSIRF